MPVPAKTKGGKFVKSGTKIAPGRTRKRRWLILATILFAAGATAFSVYRFLPINAPDPAVDFDRATQFLASADFRRLSPEQRRDFADRYRANRPHERSGNRNLSDAQRQELYRNMGEMMMGRQLENARAYFAMSPKERDAFRKQQMAAFNQMRNAANNRPRGNGNGNGNGGNRPPRPAGNGAPPNAGDRHGPGAFFKNTTPADRALLSAYMREMRRAREKK